MKTRTRIVATAISEEEYIVLRQMAFETQKTMSSTLRDILLGNMEVSKRMSSFLPTLTNKMVISANEMAP